DAGVDPAGITSGVVGNFAAGLFTRQLHLGAMLTGVDPKLRGIPTLHTEAACASGGVAVLTAAQQIMAGLHECVLVVGVEQQKTMSPTDGADVLGAAADYTEERARFGDFMFPKLFGRIAQLYAERYGLTERQLALVAVKNYAHARLNPCAQMRDRQLTLEQAMTESAENARLAPPLKTCDCSQITDGSAALLLCSERVAARISKDRRVRLLGFGHTTDHLPLDRKDAPLFSIARSSAAKAYAMAGLSPRDIDAADVHDCFSISEILATEIIGFAEPGEGTGLIESGATMLPAVREQLGIPTPSRSIPINPGGGLIGDGHPVGATGVRQVVEAYQHLTRRAGARQVAGTKRYLTFNMGGTVTTNVTMIWGNDAGAEAQSAR
ncbi:MAG TPA: beta-ketoacyl synthase N-terminal-like domain-containing protein, partial [Tepidisphaeraceae bacterium]|nr:beta-ketoacyl synthase N-terminal-like domain-containing protein [Tepidisphaeraceae bacterium]